MTPTPTPSNPPATLYLEDLKPGMRFGAPRWEVTEEELKRFAGEFDPQPFHLDHEAAKASVFGGLAASGWHTAAMMMGLFTRSELKLANGLVGMSIDGLRWHRPVRPGDALSLEVEILEVRRSTSNPGFGVVKMRWQGSNQNGEPVIEALPNLWVQARRAG